MGPHRAEGVSRNRAMMAVAGVALLFCAVAAARAQTSAGAAPPCGPGWMASATGMEGSVSGGGLTQGTTSVCGYASAPQALKAVLDLCDAQTAGGCRRAGGLRVVWGQGDGIKMNASETCESKLPLVASSSCSESAASQLRAAGVP